MNETDALRPVQRGEAEEQGESIRFLPVQFVEKVSLTDQK